MGKTTRWITTGIIGGTIVVTSIQLGNLFDLQQADQETASIANQPKITMVSKAKITNFKTTYNGKAIATKNKAISVRGKYLVPANEVLKKAGAKVSYNSKTKTLTIKAGSKTTTHKRGTNYAYINKKKTSLSTKSMVYKGVTMVPYDLVSKATTAKVTVSSATKTIKITKTVTKPADYSSIKTLYQGHDYGADNQTQYDKTMQYVNKYIDSYADNRFQFGGEYTKSYEAYFKDGVNAPKQMDYNMSDYQYGLYFAKEWGGDFRTNKVPYDTIIKVNKVSMLATNILSDANYTDHGATRDMYSAYQIFFEQRGDCDSRAHAMQAVFDKYGFTTRVKYGTTHAQVEVKIENHWYAYDSGSFSSY